VQPAGFRTGHSRASKPNSSSRVELRSVRPGKPRFQCSWWELLRGFLEILARLNDTKNWCR
jgi:hypothetical protein